MPESGLERGVVDRFVEGLAVVLVGDDEIEHQLDVAELPPGVGEGTWLRVRRSGQGLVVVGKDEEGETGQRLKVEGRLGRLRQERRSGRFERPTANGEQP
jgi:hypothetical protein